MLTKYIFYLYNTFNSICDGSLLPLGLKAFQQRISDNYHLQ